jgi:release factor glutamine methyltransferase
VSAGDSRVPDGNRSWTVLAALTWTADRFAQARLDSPRLDAELLLAHATGLDRVGLYTAHDRPLDPSERARYRELVRRRLGGEPVAYLTGEREFWSLRLAVDPRVLIPRRETEHLVEAVLGAVPAGSARVVDVGTGSGAIALALGKERPAWQIVAVDRSAGALAVARQNAAEHGVAVAFVRAAWLGPLGGPFDVVVSNPPYVRSAAISGLAAEVRCEPRAALDGGADGLDAYRVLVPQAAERLRKGGVLAFEIGSDEGRAVAELCAASGAFEPARVTTDLAGLDRVVVATRR